MKRTVRHTFAVAVFLLSLAAAFPLAAQTFKEAMDAYRARDYETAYSAFRTLADRGDPKAQSSLGDMYRKGYGRAENHAEAAKWYRRAADQGDAYAQSSLGLMYRDGLGVPLDLERAWTWFDLAVRNFPSSRGEWRDRAARNRDSITTSLTPDALARARDMAEAWRPEAADGSTPRLPAGRNDAQTQDEALPLEAIAVVVLALVVVFVFLQKRRRARRRARPADPGAGYPEPPDIGSVVAGTAYVTDGDGIRVSGCVVRFAGLDAPEWDQWAKHSDGYWFRHGERVKKALIETIGNRHVTVTVEKYDKYDRLIGAVVCDGKDVGAWLVRNGHAIAAYSDRYEHIEREARREKRGLWGYDVAFDPRAWRHRNAGRE